MSCGTQILRMSHCSRCAGQAFTRPCESVCHDVLEACLSTPAMDTVAVEWRHFFLKLKNLLPTMYLISLPMSWRELTTLYADLIQGAAHTEGAVCNASNTRTLSSPQIDLQIQNLGQLAAMLSDEIRTEMDWWSKLPVVLCSRSSWMSSLSSRDNCWNGTSARSDEWQRCGFCRSSSMSAAGGSREEQRQTMHRLLAILAGSNKGGHIFRSSYKKPQSELPPSRRVGGLRRQLQPLKPPSGWMGSHLTRPSLPAKEESEMSNKNMMKNSLNIQNHSTYIYILCYKPIFILICSIICIYHWNL